MYNFNRDIIIYNDDGRKLYPIPIYVTDEPCDVKVQKPLELDKRVPEDCEPLEVYIRAPYHRK